MLGLFSLTIFLSAALLFLVQPMVAKMLLPLLGGSPSVWNTCMVFFQAVLLAGYTYAHLVGTRLRPRTQIVVHAIVLAAAALMLPIALSAGADPGDTNPSLWVIGALAMTAGAPFFVVSTSGPLVQKWFANTGHPRSKDPYFLYAASNSGSLLGLLAYPVIVEPLLPLRSQSIAWAVGYVLLGVLLLTCAAAAAKGARTSPSVAPSSPPPASSKSVKGKGQSAAPVPVATPAPDVPARSRWPQRIRWMLCAAVPSSLMLGVTQYISTDVAAVPLLWVVPLSLYLISFILAFAASVKLDTQKLGFLVALLCIGALVHFAVGAGGSLLVPAALHLLLLFAAALMCHRVLADERPEPARLTEFYLLLSVGGVVGGAFNSLLAPVVFTSVVEYPLAIAAVCLVRPVRAAALRPMWKRLAFTLLWATIMAAAIIGARLGLISARIIGGAIVPLVAAIVPLVVLAAALKLTRSPGPFAAALLVAILLVRLAPDASGSRPIFAERTFFGVHRAYASRDNAYHTLVHGTTTHGIQGLTPELRNVPTAYFHRAGPIGQIFAAYAGHPRSGHVAIIGLGIGTLAAYAEPGDHFRFFEIDTAVVRAAEDPNLFTFLPDARARGATVDVVLGDGRLRLAQEPDGAFGIMVLDAFTSDAVPTHLLTKEAIEVYRRKTDAYGVVAFHISNNHLDLVPVVSRVAQELGVPCYLCNDQDASKFSERERKLEARRPALWMAVTADPEFPARVGKQWIRILPPDGAPLWTDQYSNLLGILRN